ncbi:hypothetical protein ZHAS_00010586 [Anopheles sinensis]|uniref:Uncharacterized protein n=1 Tax=Anopheles sinensis TaxID=74873 RepID=A0A084VXY5_ANOSI|nr:hypothetical protein ZHAS_00010586 [Anopheles sinensis]
MSYNADDCPDSASSAPMGEATGDSLAETTSTELNCATPTSPGMTRQNAIIGDGGSIDGDAGYAETTAAGPLAGYEPCDPLIILNLFQSLSATTNSLELQMKINLHLIYRSEKKEWKGRAGSRWDVVNGSIVFRFLRFGIGSEANLINFDQILNREALIGHAASRRRPLCFACRLGVKAFSIRWPE